MKVFVVNLAASTDRRAAMIAQLKTTGLDWEIFHATDGRRMQSEDLERMVDMKAMEARYGRRINLGEVGCAISHQRIYKKMAEEKIENAIVLEDDVLLIDHFESVLKMVIRRAPINSVIKLEDNQQGQVYSVWGRLNIDNYSKLFRVIGGRVHGTYGYYIDLAAAKTLLGLSKRIMAIADDWRLYAKKIRVYALNPPIVFLDRRYVSDIWQDDSLKHYEYEKKKSNLILRVIRRMLAKLDVSVIHRVFPWT